MACGLITSTRAHLASLGRSSNSQDSPQDVEFPDSRFLSAARKCQNSPLTLRIRTPKDRFLKLSSTYIHPHSADIKDLIETFLDEYGCDKIMEVCETEIVLGRDLEELLGSVGEGSRGRGACCSLRLLRPELGCRISLDIQTRSIVSRWLLSKTRETQLVCIALESLTSSPFATPVKDKNFLGSKVRDGEGRKGKVYACWGWKTVRVGGVSFLWGKDLVVDAARAKKRPCLFTRVARKVKVKHLGSEGSKGGGEQELKPLLI